jgi:hypothetical protein
MSDSAKGGLVITVIYLGIFAMPWIAAMLKRSTC